MTLWVLSTWTQQQLNLHWLNTVLPAWACDGFSNVCIGLMLTCVAYFEVHFARTPNGLWQSALALLPTTWKCVCFGLLRDGVWHLARLSERFRPSSCLAAGMILGSAAAVQKHHTVVVSVRARCEVHYSCYNHLLLFFCFPFSLSFPTLLSFPSLMLMYFSLSPSFLSVLFFPPASLIVSFSCLTLPL